MRFAVAVTTVLSSPAFAQVLPIPIEIIPIPEPGTLALLAIGLVYLIRYGNRARKPRNP